MRFAILRAIILWSAVPMMVAGCGGGQGVRLAKVEGTVTVGDSQPFAKGTVRFFPRTKGVTGGGSAATDDNGSFVMIHQSGRKGLEPGEYQVSFSLYKMPDGSEVVDKGGGDEQKNPSELGAIEFVPAEYATINSDKNIVTVDKNGGKFDFKIPQLNSPKSSTKKR